MTDLEARNRLASLLEGKERGSLSALESEECERLLVQMPEVGAEHALRAFAERFDDDQEQRSIAVESVLSAFAQRAPRPRRKPMWVFAAAAALMLAATGASAAWIAAQRGFFEPTPEPTPEAAARTEPKSLPESVPLPSSEVPASEFEPDPKPKPSIDTSADRPASRRKPRGRVQASTPRPAPVQDSKPVLEAPELLERANEARRERRWSTAVRWFETLVDTHPTSPESRVARVSLGRLLMDRLDEPARALEHFERYLSTAPNGALAEAAMVSRALALSRLNRDANERRAWQDLLDRFPESLHAEHARSRLKALD
ncbi:MAG: outer membrane protein assembly factor BamD [Myxococcota bacterium]